MFLLAGERRPQPVHVRALMAHVIVCLCTQELELEGWMNCVCAHF